MKDIDELKKGLEVLTAYYNQRKGQRDRLKLEVEKKQQEVELLQQKLDMLTKVKLIFQVAAENAREQARQHIEQIVTSALQSVFGPDISFEVALEEKRDRPEVEFLVASTYGGTARIANRPEDSRGGGVVDVVSIALRSALLEGMYPRLDGIMVYDEPAKHVSEEYSTAVAELIKGISEDMGRQIIMVTHNQHLAESGEIAYKIILKKGISSAERIK